MRIQTSARIFRIGLAIFSVSAITMLAPVQAQIKKSSQSSQISNTHNAKSTSQPTSLLKMTCRSGTPGFEQPLRGSSRDIAVGREALKEVAFLHTFYAVVSSTPMIGANDPAIATCRLNPKFKNLSLEFGLDSTSNLTNDKAQLLLSVYLDNNLVGEKQLVRGSKESLSIDLSNARNITLEAKCTQSSGISNSCPGVSFTNMTLK
ncbi:hypothetical protein BZZ01_11705 [Nostocales cyanobacterium HT-58-2]|nr:hypothetical protein BZZ01_11705 [Nostocales cyanobacterium HT-58-2]